MSQSTRNRDQPTWSRIRMIAASRAHRLMKKQTSKLPTNVCPIVDEKVNELIKADDFAAAIFDFRRWLGQLHTDYVNALEHSQVQLVKARIALRDEQRRNREQRAV